MRTASSTSDFTPSRQHATSTPARVGGVSAGHRRHLVLAVLAIVAIATGCEGSFARRAHPFVFPDALVNANLGPQPVVMSSADPFGWGTPEQESAYASASTRRQAGDDATDRVYPAGSPDDGFVGTPAATSPMAKVASASTLEPGPQVNLGPPKAPAPPRSAQTAAPDDLQDGPPADDYDQAGAAAFVAAVYDVNGVDLKREGEPTIVDLYRKAYRGGVLYHSDRPAVGDLVFFHNTYDRNRDGRWNDWYTLVAVVESVGSDGTVAALAYVGDRVQRISLNVNDPEKLRDAAGHRLNTNLRAAGDAIPSGKSGAAGKLFAGFANLLGDAKQVVVIDNWQPGMQASR